MTSATGAFTGNDEHCTWIWNRLHTVQTRSTLRRPLILVETPSCVACCCLCGAVSARRSLIVGAALQLCSHFYLVTCANFAQREQRLSVAHTDTNAERTRTEQLIRARGRAFSDYIIHNTKRKKPLPCCQAWREFVKERLYVEEKCTCCLKSKCAHTESLYTRVFSLYIDDSKCKLVFKRLYPQTLSDFHGDNL